MFVFDILLRLAWWQSAGKEVSSWLVSCVVLLYAILIGCVPFLFGVGGRMWKDFLHLGGHSP